MTSAHTEHESFRFTYTFPAHEPRESDCHYHWFDEAKKRLTHLGALQCWINNRDCQGQIELHHNIVEYALANDVDVTKFAHLYPEFHITDDEGFLRAINSEGGLLPLCVVHHRGVIGIHSIHYPAWLVQRFMKDGVTAPERKEVH